MAEVAAGLTEDQEEFMKTCEEKFKNRFTDEDEDFMTLHGKSIDDPPIIAPWYAFRPRRNRRDDREDGSGRSGGNSGDWSGNRDRHSYRGRSGNSHSDRDYNRHSDNRHRPYNSNRHDNRRYDDQRHHGERRNW